MKFILLLLPLLLYSKSFRVSPIPLPKTYIQNLEIYECSLTCREDLLQRGLIFSFLAYTHEEDNYHELNDIHLVYSSLFNLGSGSHDTTIKIALILPSSRIGRYAASTTNATFSYMLTKNSSFELETFEIIDESEESLQNALQKIQEKHFFHVIAPLTKKGANNIVKIESNVILYIPTVNIQDISTQDISNSIYFGGIDYRKQIETLLSYSTTPLVIFRDESRLAKELHDFTQIAYFSSKLDTTISMDEIYTDELDSLEVQDKNIISMKIDKRTTNLEKQLKNNRNIQMATFFLDTPIVKSSLIMSQLTLHDVNKTNILSTQINYDPLLLSITQYKDREKMLIANSISQKNTHMSETNTLFENDIDYDWINYSTTIGVDFFYNLITNEERLYKLPIRNNQIQYPISLMKPEKSRFSVHKTYLDDSYEDKSNELKEEYEESERFTPNQDSM